MPQATCQYGIPFDFRQLAERQAAHSSVFAHLLVDRQPGDFAVEDLGDLASEECSEAKISAIK
tara:strand:+ start:1972 stop:2160 length:189 start_codon:yes stop_codon:yes gene_type:complete